MIPMCYPSDHLDGKYIANWALWLILELYEYKRRSPGSSLVSQMEERVRGILSFMEGLENEEGLLENVPGLSLIHILVLRTAGISLPSEDTDRLLLLRQTFRRTFIGHYLGRMFRSPLGEQMGEFQVMNSTAFTQSDPPLQLFKAECITGTGAVDIHKLYSRPLAPGGCVQRRCEQRSQDHIDAVGCGAEHIFFHKLPIAFAEYRNVIPVGNAVRMEPFSVEQGLFWKLRRQPVDGKGAGCLLYTSRCV